MSNLCKVDETDLRHLHNIKPHRQIQYRQLEEESGNLSLVVHDYYRNNWAMIF